MQYAENVLTKEKLVLFKNGTTILSAQDMKTMGKSQNSKYVT